MERTDYLLTVWKPPVNLPSAEELRSPVIIILKQSWLRIKTSLIRNSWTPNPLSMIHLWDICVAAITTGREVIRMLNEETRRKLRLLNIGEFVEELEIQQQDPQTLALPFDDRFQGE